MGSFSILNNIAGINAQQQLNINNTALTRTLLRLSSGKRINSGADDAAGLQIADTLRANIKALDQAVRNSNDGIAVAQIADGTLQELTNILTRAVTLAEESGNGTIDDAGRAAIQQEWGEAQREIARIATQTNFNGRALFTANGLNGTLSIFVGDISSLSSIAVTINMITVNGPGTSATLGGIDLTTLDLTTMAGARSALTGIKTALASVASNRGTIGAGINRLQAAVAVLMNQSQNSQAAESTIRDANIAEEVSNLTKYQILAQSGLASLAQANATAQNVLSLLRGQ